MIFFFKSSSQKPRDQFQPKFSQGKLKFIKHCELKLFQNPCNWNITSELDKIFFEFVHRRARPILKGRKQQKSNNSLEYFQNLYFNQNFNETSLSKGNIYFGRNEEPSHSSREDYRKASRTELISTNFYTSYALLRVAMWPMDLLLRYFYLSHRIWT